MDHRHRRGFPWHLRAGFNGASFLNYSEDVSSLNTSDAFLVALRAYALGLFHTKSATVHAA